MDNIMLKVSRWLSIVAGVALTFMMLLTVADVLGRAFGHPIMGSYEIVGYTLGLVIGFAIPYVSMNKQHVYMDFIVENVSKRNKAILVTFTRLLNISLFLLITYALFVVGNEYRTSGETSPTIMLPFYPMAYGVAACCFIECIVFVGEIVKSWRAVHE
ncbi:MAG: TRAP transporter small permease [Deltaproteobacteria bacterium]|nr:TRAP transporter small permease [Deltaproteobacteria bacterium]